MVFVHDISPVLVDFGALDVRWYGLLFAVGLALNYLILQWIFKREKYQLAWLESLAVWMFVGLVVGARLGEVLFYEPGYYFSNPGEIIKIWNGGLASHGAAIGLFLAYFSWCKFHKLKFSKLINAIVVPIPLTAAFIRLGNFFNSEIIGHPTNGDYGVVFARLGEDFARHPVQLYSSLMNLMVFAVMFWVYKKKFKEMPPMSMLFLYLLLYFGGRFVVEFWKDLQGPIPESFGITTGQFLSLIPIGIALVWFGWQKFMKSKG